MQQTHATVLAAPPPTPQIGNGPFTPPNPTAQEIAIGNEKQVLAKEYMGMLKGNEPLAAYEQHMSAFMQKHNLGNIANLHTVLTQGNKKKAPPLHQNAAPASCPQVATRGVVPNTLCPVYAAQFPEERSGYCSDATVSTALVEDSFAWGRGVLSYYDPLNGITTSLGYNPYVVTQPAPIALADEDKLALEPHLLNNPDPLGAGPDAVMRTLNDFVNGHGGNYSEVTYGNVAGRFQNDLVNDINQGWDLAGGLYIYDRPKYATLPGYTGHGDFEHWIPITFYNNGGATTFYSDPIYAAPGYGGWAIPTPYESTATSNMIAILSRFVYLW